MSVYFFLPSDGRGASCITIPCFCASPPPDVRLRAEHSPEEDARQYGDEMTSLLPIQFELIRYHGMVYSPSVPGHLGLLTSSSFLSRKQHFRSVVQYSFFWLAIPFIFFQLTPIPNHCYLFIPNTTKKEQIIYN